MMKPWKTLARTKLLEHSPFLAVENHIVELPDGRIIDDWAWIITPDFVNVDPVTADNKIICFRQFKYAVEGLTLAPIGGHIDRNEDPLAAARRELIEETGYEAQTWIHLGSFRPLANRGAGMGHAFLAYGARKVCEPASDDLEEQELLFLDVDEVQQALIQGEFKVFSWATTVALALMRFDKSRDPGPGDHPDSSYD
ncbi:MAG: NUDIX hydrolase [Anaerolineales bacterium]|nr:NUDIX hydrolase [Anaerolineales bacterium]